MKKLATFLVFICSMIIFIISVNLFYQMGIFVDENNTTPSAICGGDFWLMADWLRLALSGFLTIFSGIAFLRSGKK